MFLKNENTIIIQNGRLTENTVIMRMIEIRPVSLVMWILDVNSSSSWYNTSYSVSSECREPGKREIVQKWWR